VDGVSANITKGSANYSPDPTRAPGNASGQTLLSSRRPRWSDSGGRAQTRVSSMLNVFYAEADGDRWLPLDRYPRRAIRRILRGPPVIGGHQRVYLNLRAGLDLIGARYRVNDHEYASSHPEEVACILGKPFLLEQHRWRNPIVFGPAGYSHPSDDPALLERLDVRKVIVPGEWMRKMFEPYWGDVVAAWPVGIDTGLWKPEPGAARDMDVLVYDKIRWERETYEPGLLRPVLDHLHSKGLSSGVLRYGAYQEHDFRRLLLRCQAMVFLCEHETQGIAYQQALSAGVPLFAWDRGGFLRDPAYYPHRVRFAPVSSVPYWDRRCGMTFPDAAQFARGFDEFWEAVKAGAFRPRDYILEHLTLERSARLFLDIVEGVGRAGNPGRENGVAQA